MSLRAARTILTPAVAMIALVLCAPSASAQPQSKSQQKCINKMNKAGGKVCLTQDKDAGACIKGFFKGQLPGSAQGCLTTDLKGKIAKVHSKTVGAETKLCGPSSLPDFAFTSATVVNAAATNQALALVADVFGSDLDSALSPGDEKCQRKVHKAYGKILKEKLKIFLKCKKEALKLGTANVDDLANTCLAAIVADTKGKIAKGITKLTEALIKYCPPPGPALDTLFPGQCFGAPTSQAWAMCIDVQVEGRVCEKLSQMDAFTFDCDLFDDGIICNSGDQNGDETDVDCGGPTCPVCSDGFGCSVGADCESGVCVGNICQAPTCSDGVVNGDETDIDCGGLTCTVCVDGSGCSVGADCQSGVCTGNVCQVPTCTDGVLNGDEGDVDCGGSFCAACPDGSGCNVGPDCQSGACSANICQPPSCGDGVQNGDETDIDCGGLTCAACPTGSGCGVAADCQSSVCTANICQAPTCSDGVLNGDESDVDCGGSTCAGCPSGSGCGDGADCESGVCTASVCQAPTCGDAVQNGTETDVDCGGSCPVCALGEGCLVAGDCLSASCVGSTCTCGNQGFTFNISSNSGGLFDSAEWPGGTQTQTTSDPACSVRINNPSDNIDLVCALAPPFSINTFSGFSNCFGSGGPNGDGCQALTCPPLGIPSCCPGIARPSCSAALNGSGTARYLVQCLD